MLAPAKTAIIVVLEILRAYGDSSRGSLLFTDAVRLVSVVMKVAEALEQEAAAQARTRRSREGAAISTESGRDVWIMEWPGAVKAKVGSHLVNLFMQTAKMEDPIT